MPTCTTCPTGWARTRPAETTTWRLIAGCFPAGERVANPRSRWRSAISRLFDDLTAGVRIHPHGGENAIAGQQVIGGFQVPRARRRDSHDGLDRGRSMAHDHDAVGELYGLIDVVGDKENRLPLLLPDPQEVCPQLEAGNVVEGSEWLVRVDDLGTGRQPAGGAPLVGRGCNPSYPLSRSCKRTGYKPVLPAHAAPLAFVLLPLCPAPDRDVSDAQPQTNRGWKTWLVGRPCRLVRTSRQGRQTLTPVLRAAPQDPARRPPAPSLPFVVRTPSGG